MQTRECAKRREVCACLGTVSKHETNASLQKHTHQAVSGAEAAEGAENAPTTKALETSLQLETWPKSLVWKLRNEWCALAHPLAGAPAHLKRGE